jgi:hypothetical protein
MKLLLTFILMTLSAQVVAQSLNTVPVGHYLLQRKSPTTGRLEFVTVAPSNGLVLGWGPTGLPIAVPAVTSVTSVTGTGNVNGLTLTGTVTSTGSLTLGGTLSVPIATGISGLATGVATFLGTASSANLRTAITDETGTGALYFTGGSLGAPTAGDFSAGSFTWPTFNQNTTGSAATLTTARTINGVSFNGSANVTVPAALATLTGGGNHKVLYLNGSGVPTELALGTAGQVFQSNGPTSAPSFVTPSGGAGSYDSTITSLALLAAKATVALPVNTTIITVIISTEMQDWQLVAGSNTTSTGIQRPNDYNASTNIKVWFRRR